MQRGGGSKSVVAPPKQFTFDHSYWSHDGFRADENGYFWPAPPEIGGGCKYADQVQSSSFYTELLFTHTHFTRVLYIRIQPCASGPVSRAWAGPGRNRNGPGSGRRPKPFFSAL
jgi:hypothetical protein